MSNYSVKEAIKSLRRQVIKSDELEKILRDAFGKDASIYLVDYDYYLVDKAEMEKFLAEDKTNMDEYIPEYHDCDDFSFRLMGQVSVPGWSGLAFGIVFALIPGGGHAINCFVSEDKKVYIVEPQSDKIFETPKTWQVFFCLM